MNDQYYIRVETRMACGCNVVSAMELPPGVEPCGSAIMMTLIEQLSDVDWLALLTDDRHVERGNERVTIELKTMVGPAPDPEDL